MENISRNLPNICTFSLLRSRFLGRHATLQRCVTAQKTAAKETNAPLASFVTPSRKDHEVRDRPAHRTDDVVKKARCACTHDVIQDGAENAGERRKNLLQSLPQYHKIPNYHRMPKIRMRSPNVERNKLTRIAFKRCDPPKHEEITLEILVLRVCGLVTIKSGCNVAILKWIIWFE